LGGIIQTGATATTVTAAPRTSTSTSTSNWTSTLDYYFASSSTVDITQRAVELQAALADATKVDALFSDYVRAYSKTYATVDATLGARTTFAANLGSVAELNQDPARTTVFACNGLCDRTFDDLSSTMLMPSLADTQPLSNDNASASAPSDPAARRLLTLTNLPVPTSLDWRMKGAVTPVRNQYSCGSCWAFSATGALESAYLLSLPTLTCRTGVAPTLAFSPQQLVDCVTGAYNAKYRADRGCNGGWSEDAFDYMYTKYQVTEKTYPYMGRTGVCQSVAIAISKPGVRISMAQNYAKSTKTRNVLALLQLLQNGPAVVYFAVDKRFQLYRSGIFMPAASCNNIGINHAMLLVGYSMLPGQTPYWVFKNSWGTGWGEAGFIRVAMTDDGIGACNMYTYAATRPNAPFDVLPTKPLALGC
jgi:C1A family cysteine protease